MMINTSFYSLVLMILFSILTVMHAAEPDNPCPNNHEVIDMCTYASVEENDNYGNKGVDSVSLRITKHQNNCVCHVTLPNTVTNFTIYMSKYDLMQIAAPEEQNCGLAVDVENVDKSNTSRHLPPIECTKGTGVRSIVLGDNGLRLKSRIINGNFSRGYCMQIYRNEPLYTCNMIDLLNHAGTDVDWIATGGTQHTSFIECKRYCLDTETCASVHYDNNNEYCFVYNRSTLVFKKPGSNYSQKHCKDIKKLKIRCFLPELITTTSQSYSHESTTKTSQSYFQESTTKTSQSYSQESTTKTSQSYSQESTIKTSQGTTTEDNRSTKTETVITPTSDIPVTSVNTQSTITVENDIAKDERNSDLYVYIGAAAGGVLMILLIMCIIMCLRKRSNQTSLKETQHASTQNCSNENGDSNYDYGGLKDNILYVSSEPNEVLEDGNYNTVDLEQTRKVDQDNTFDGNYSTIDGICNINGSDSSLSKSKPVIKPKPKKSLKRGSDEETIHLSAMDNSNNEYAVVDKGRNSDSVKHINPEHGNDTEYAVVNKVRK